MGGLIILSAILIPTLLFAKLHNIHVITMLIATVWLGMIGFIDDFIKVKFKQNLGLTALQKVIAQLAIAIAFSIYAYNSRG